MPMATAKKCLDHYSTFVLLQLLYLSKLWKMMHFEKDLMVMGLFHLETDLVVKVGFLV